MVPGVAGVDTIGGFQKEYHVQPDPAKLIGLDLSFGDLANAIESNNVNRGAGYLEDNGESFVVRSSGRLESIRDIGNVVVATRGGIPVRVKDVAEVKLGRELRTGSASENGEEAVIGTALMLIGGNSRSVSAMVDAKMKEISRSLPPDIEVETVLNRTLLVDATVKTVATNLAEGAFLVILVLFLLLGNFRAAFITALVIPIAMLLTMAGMVQGKISANLDEPRRPRFWSYCRWRCHHHREQPEALGWAPARDPAPARSNRASEHCDRVGAGDDQAYRLWPSHHYFGLCAAPDFHRHRRKDVRADGADRHHRACRLRSSSL